MKGLGKLAAVVVLTTAGGLLAAEHTHDSLDAVKMALTEQKAVLVDVRERPEWEAGHLRDARLLPLSNLSAGVDPTALARSLPRDKVVYCHCASGRRCLQAADVLRKYGYDVRPLKQGYQTLLRAGFPGAER
jgi:phage shock protein E